MQRFLLICAFVLLLILDVSVVSQTLLFAVLEVAFGSVGHVWVMVPLLVVSAAAGAALIWLTMLVWKALRAGQRGAGARAAA
jgi:hypothetical protein